MKRKNPVSELLKGLGIKADFCKKTKHIKINCSYHGETFIMIAPGTPSDHRAMKNFKANVCREIRGIDERKKLVNETFTSIRSNIQK